MVIPSVFYIDSNANFLRFILSWLNGTFKNRFSIISVSL